MKRLCVGIVFAVLNGSWASAEAPKVSVPLYLEEFRTTGWEQGGGEYRAYTFNSEVNPCLQVESVRYAGKPEGVIANKTICQIEDGQEVVDLKNDVMESEISGLRWEKNELHFQVEYMLARVASVSTNLDCSGSFHEAKFVYKCQEKKEE